MITNQFHFVNADSDYSYIDPSLLSITYKLYQLPAHFSVVLLLERLHLLPLPDLLLQLLVVHGLVVLVCRVPDIVADSLLNTLVSLEPEQS